MTVFTAESLYIRAHLDYSRKEGVIKHVSNLRSGLGRHKEILYTTPTVWVLCELRDGKMGRAAA